MKRTTWGSILLVIGGLLVIVNLPTVMDAIANDRLADLVLEGNNSGAAMEWLALGLVGGGVGFFLLRSGLAASHQKSTIEAQALEMLRTEGEIDFAAIAHKTGISEADVRRAVKRARDDGAVPR
jgi:hypothetical protein